MTAGPIAVIDIGKSNAKLALVDPADLSEIAVVTRPNIVVRGPPYRHFDVAGIWDFILGALARFQARHGIGAIAVTTHGAAGALLAANGGLAAPILDYEDTGPDAVAADYDALRPGFGQTGSPRLPMGLNLGAQIFWQFRQEPDLHDRTARIVTYPQYWGFRLTGEVACDLSSLGCHTDLWNPYRAVYSSLAERLDIAGKMAPARPSAEILGQVLPEIARRTGLARETAVHCGIHDSNASLLPHVLGRTPPFSVVSTGTWVIAMTVGGTGPALDPSRDTLANVNALGDPVPSARFMGGREFEIIAAGGAMACDNAVLNRIARDGPLLLPAVVSDSGPFQGRRHRWVGAEPEPGTAERTAALGFYLALMTAECLSLTGHRGEIIVEGPFARNSGYCAMLAAASDCPVLSTGGSTGTSQGAAMLATGTSARPAPRDVRRHKPDALASFRAYARAWRSAVSG